MSVRAACLALWASVLAAQPARRIDPSPADLAIARGQLDEAETQLFEASRVSPRDPVARGALGSFLAARGRLKVGAVLLEEARQFGGEARAIDERLAHIYGWLGSWDLVAALPGNAALDAPRRARAAYLARNPTSFTGPDSSAVLLEPNELAGLGRVAIEVGSVTLPADVDASIEGLVLPATTDMMGAVEFFGNEGGASLAVAHTMTIGRIALRNVPARLEPVASARVGLDVLARLTPAFDMTARTLTLHSGPAGSARGDELRILLTFPGVRIVARADAAPVALESAAGRAALRGARWTFDLKRGAVIVAR
jgi:hypothetical protein